MVLLLLLTALAQSARAQNDVSAAPPAAAAPVGDATTVEVTGPDAAAVNEADENAAASQVASFAVTKLKDSPAVVTVISGDDIRTSGARDLIDILNLVPGYFVGQDVQDMVGAGFRGLWGQEGKILLMIDGKEMNELLYSTLQLGNEFPVELIERVEVVRGPGSVIYGGSAELSVINVVTRSVQGATDATAHVVYGQMTGAHQLSTGYARRRITASGRYVFDSVPGLSTFASVSIGEGQRSVRTFVDNGGMEAGMEGQSALNPAVVQAGVGYRDLQATFLFHHLATSSIAPLGFVLDGPKWTYFDAYHGEVMQTFHLGNSFEIVPRINLTYQRPWRAPDTNTDFYFDAAVRRTRFRLLGRWAALDLLQVTVGGDAIFDYAKLLAPAGPGQQLPFGTSNDVSYQTLAGFLELYSENPLVNVSAGVRYDHLSTVGGDFVPRLVLLRALGPVSLKGLFSLSFRAPGVENLNLAFAGTRVRPERTRVFEFEASVDLPGRQRVSANVFDLLIDAPIAYTLDPVTGDQGYLNLGKQGTRGFEVAYSWRAQWAKLEANYSFYSPTVVENLAAYLVPGHPNQFMGAPSHRGSVRGTVWVGHGVGVSPTAVILGSRYTRGAPSAAGAETAASIPAQVLANLFVFSDRVGIPGLTVGLGIYNMFGANYRYVHISTSAATFAEDQAPFPGLDREVMLRVGYQFEPSGS